ncbi:MAG: NAD(P)-dependent oxidoreductase [Variibacter sp.]
MARILLTHTPEMRHNYYGDGALAALRKHGDVILHEGAETLAGARLVEAAKGCQFIVADRATAGPPEVFENSPDLIAFLRVAVDISTINVPAASKAGVLVTQATPGFIASVTEMALGFMIDLGRSITEATNAYRAGQEMEPRMGNQLKGATLGIIGYGAIGRNLAPLGVALGMTVLVSDPFQTIATPGVTQADLETLLAQSDYVVCLAIANKDTENLMNAAAFARMKPTAFFINMSRGQLVDEDALEQALDQKRIAGAAMDVGRAPDQRPSMRLAKRSDVIATPHTAGLTPQAAEHQAFDTVKQVGELVAGRVPPGAVNVKDATRLSRLKS